jgi:hypothetical protein
MQTAIEFVVKTRITIRRNYGFHNGYTR